VFWPSLPGDREALVARRRPGGVTRYVGVDGCSGGWFAVAHDPDEPGGVDFGLHSSFAAVVDAHPDAERMLVDVPIGLPTTGRRRCDVDARERLGSRASTVFFAPCRAVLDAPDHETASELNRDRTGYGLSIQAWHLVPRVREVDAVLRADASARDRTVEAHPELCFAALGDGPVPESKTTEAGRRERLDRLRPVLPDADAVYEAALDAHYRKHVARDDVVDAMVLAASAPRPLGRVPAVPDGRVPRDGVGLPMEIRFPTNGAFDR
jgi:predicted RNase H-like nuclease